MNKTSDIAAVIASKYDLSQADAERFVAAMFEVVDDSLQAGEKQVKVKGLGTFKVTSVSSRESVNVNNGERIVIEGRNKISFTPDNTLKDRVNMPFAQFDTVVLNDGVDFSDLDKADAEPSFEHDDSDTASAQHDTSKVMQRIAETQNNEKEAEKDGKEAPEANDEKEPHVIATPLVDTPMTEETAERKAPETESEQPVATPMATATATTQAEDSDETPNSEPLTAVDEDANQAHQQHSTVTPIVHNEGENAIAQKPAQAEDEIKHTSDNNLEEKIMHEVKSKNKTIIGLMTVIIALLIFCTCCIYHYKHELTMSNNRILELEITLDNLQAELHKNDSVKPKATPEPSKPIAKKPQEAPAPAPKAAPTKPAEAAKPAEKAQAKPVNGSKYDSDPRIRTGAYVITGIEKTVSVRKGQTLQSISRTLLGPGMECYMEAVNEKREYKEGEKVKVPALKLKRAAMKK